MVIEVLNQDYLTESCVSLLGIPEFKDDRLTEQCVGLIKAEVEGRSVQTQLETAQKR